MATSPWLRRQRRSDLAHRPKRAPVANSVADNLVTPDPVAVTVARRAEEGEEESKILDGGHLAAIEPELDGILDRFDDIEPHLPWVLENIDYLAPYVS